MNGPYGIERNVSLSSYTSWKVGGGAEFWSQPSDIDGFLENVRWALSKDLPITVLGGGTNVLISDEGIPGLVLSTKKIVGFEEVVDENFYYMSVMSGTPKHEIMRAYLKKKLSPALFLSGLPGDIGGGVAMNAGVREELAPREFVEIVEWVDVLNWDDRKNVFVKRYNHKDLEWAYRHCQGWGPGVILKVGLKWPNHPDERVRGLVIEANKRRLSKQPLDKPSCGSVFKNPQGASSGALIEECGLKGFSIGGAQVSEKHANFIINTGQASAKDVKELINHIYLTVKERKEIHLESEVILLGFS